MPFWWARVCVVFPVVSLHMHCRLLPEVLALVSIPAALADRLGDVNVTNETAVQRVWRCLTETPCHNLSDMQCGNSGKTRCSNVALEAVQRTLRRKNTSVEEMGADRVQGPRELRFGISKKSYRKALDAARIG